MKVFKHLPHPLKLWTVLFLRKTGTSVHSFRNKIPFKGKFKVKLAGSSFYMNNYGGRIENETFWEGPFKSWEREMGDVWIRLCKNSEVVFDIGANTGIYSLIAKSLNNNNQVFAFEPSINTFSKLVTNVKLNNFNIQTEKTGLSNIRGKQLFYDLPDQHQTTASFSPDKLKNAPYYKGELLEYEMETTTLSEYIESNKIRKIDLMKIDVEMHEPEVLEGLGKYLLIFKPIIILEVLSNEIAGKLNSLIKPEEFRFFHLKASGKIKEMEKFSLIEGTLQSQEWNYLFFHREIEDKVRAAGVFNLLEK